jgi:hypothetical protein
MIAERDACTAQSSDEARLASEFRRALPFVQTVAVTVAGAGRSLSAYVAARCKGAALPLGKGRVVLSQAGSGFVTSKAFTVYAKHWSVDFENDGALLLLFLSRGGKLQPQTFTATKRGAGSARFTGVGRFQLRISGFTWKVRVRDGA